MIKRTECFGNLRRYTGWVIKQRGADDYRDVEQPRKLDQTHCRGTKPVCFNRFRQLKDALLKVN
jgi:hypothetical protein